jgi:hypothetical protein
VLRLTYSLSVVLRQNLVCSLEAQTKGHFANEIRKPVRDFAVLGSIPESTEVRIGIALKNILGWIKDNVPLLQVAIR